jgi:bacterioferritin
MKGDAKIIEALNQILTGELTGINQYFIHSRMCRNWGYERLAKKNYEESIGEMKHADEIIERVLYLEGVPNMQRLNKVRVGETVPEQLKLDRALEIEAISVMNKTVELAVARHDNGTREIVEEMLRSEEEHLDWLEAQLELIGQVGVQNYPGAADPRLRVGSEPGSRAAGGRRVSPAAAPPPTRRSCASPSLRPLRESLWREKRADRQLRA